MSIYTRSGETYPFSSTNIQKKKDLYIFKSTAQEPQIERYKRDYSFFYMKASSTITSTTMIPSQDIVNNNNNTSTSQNGNDHEGDAAEVLTTTKVTTEASYKYSMEARTSRINQRELQPFRFCLFLALRLPRHCFFSFLSVSCDCDLSPVHAFVLVACSSRVRCYE